ncbi:MAG: hypothetical protein KatS3mg105_4388 [Gemmatales bacterium]|nr:MAG: hypothetical protein KatS3mg105_4388 [Gemmatales bacterium]
MIRNRLSLSVAASLLSVSLGCAPGFVPEANIDAPPSKDSATLHAPTELPQGPKARLRATIRHVRDRQLLTTNGFWTVLHGILGLGPNVELHDPETGKVVNALDYICNGGEIRGLRFVPTKDGLDVQIGPMGIGQGHQDQFIAEMAQWSMPLDRKFYVYGKEYSFKDFVQHCKMRASVQADQELSWALVVLSQYLGTDIAWINSAGEQISFEDILRYELQASIDQAACGGTHRLFGITWAYHWHRKRGGKVTGVWKDAEAKIAHYVDLARKYQNPDGSFSTDYFRGRGHAENIETRISTTGHMLEWLALALPDDEIKKPWVQEAANALALMILQMQDSPIEGGSLYHAMHGLLMYYARVYGSDELIPKELLIPRYDLANFQPPPLSIPAPRPRSKS